MELSSLTWRDSLRKRICNEIRQLVESKICLESEVKISEVLHPQPHQVRYLIQFPHLEDGNTYTFDMAYDHPFTPPRLIINGKPSIPKHLNGSPHFYQSLKKYTGIYCFCCHSILCSSMWTPAYSMRNILAEHKYFKNAAREVILRLIIDVIKRKYLVMDLPIAGWLYPSTDNLP